MCTCMSHVLVSDEMRTSYIHNVIAKSPLGSGTSPLEPVGKVSLCKMNRVADSDLPAWATKSPKYCEAYFE